MKEPTDFVEALLLQPVSSWLARTVGAVILVAGVAFSFLIATTLYTTLARRTIGNFSGVVFICGLVLLATFLVVVGFRLLFSRPNKYQSLLSPSVWMFLGLAFTLLSGLIARSMLNGNSHVELETPICTLLLGVGCFWLAQRSRRKSLARNAP